MAAADSQTLGDVMAIESPEDLSSAAVVALAELLLAEAERELQEVEKPPLPDDNEGSLYLPVYSRRHGKRQIHDSNARTTAKD